MDTNEKFKNDFSIRDSFFVFLNQDATICVTFAPPPVALSARTTEIGKFTRGFCGKFK